jgi:hypothetical protein
MESGCNVYTLQRAARRSWRIGQKQAVNVFFLGYAGSAQMQCLPTASRFGRQGMEQLSKMGTTRVGRVSKGWTGLSVSTRSTSS